jgi:hypothetical protein
MQEIEFNNIFKKIKNYFFLKKILVTICYFLIAFALIIYLKNFFQTKQTIRIITQIQDEKNQISAEKIMTNPRITIEHDDNKIYTIKAKSAINHNNQDINLEEVYAESDIGKISAGELKILDEGERLIFSKNPILILNK